MTTPVFDWSAVRAGEKVATTLPVAAADAEIAIPVLVVSAGVHGDEYEGVQAIFDVCRALDPAEMRGSLVAVPIANPPAFWNGTRTSPIDGGNLARVFPGDAAGPATEAIAFHFDGEILPLADLYLDLHSAGTKWRMPTLIGFHEAIPASAACCPGRCWGSFS